MLLENSLKPNHEHSFVALIFTDTLSSHRDNHSLYYLIFLYNCVGSSICSISKFVYVDLLFEHELGRKVEMFTQGAYRRWMSWFKKKHGIASVISIHFCNHFYWAHMLHNTVSCDSFAFWSSQKKAIWTHCLTLQHLCFKCRSHQHISLIMSPVDRTHLVLEDFESWNTWTYCMFQGYIM